jgi:hypothetical protein
MAHVVLVSPHCRLSLFTHSDIQIKNTNPFTISILAFATAVFILKQAAYIYAENMRQAGAECKPFYKG